jgi:hypothetical protein
VAVDLDGEQSQARRSVGCGCAVWLRGVARTSTLVNLWVEWVDSFTELVRRCSSARRNQVLLVVMLLWRSAQMTGG